MNLSKTNEDNYETREKSYDYEIDEDNSAIYPEIDEDNSAIPLEIDIDTLLHFVVILLILAGIAVLFMLVPKNVNGYMVTKLQTVEWQTSVDIYKYQISHRQSVDTYPPEAFNITSKIEYDYDDYVKQEHTVYSYDIYTWNVVDTKKVSGSDTHISNPVVNDQYLPIDQTEKKEGNLAIGPTKEIFEITMLDEKDNELYCALVDKDFWEACNRYKIYTSSTTIEYKYDGIQRKYTEINLVNDGIKIASVDFSKIDY